MLHDTSSIPLRTVHTSCALRRCASKSTKRFTSVAQQRAAYVWTAHYRTVISSDDHSPLLTGVRRCCYDMVDVLLWFLRDVLTTQFCQCCKYHKLCGVKWTNCVYTECQKIRQIIFVIGYISEKGNRFLFFCCYLIRKLEHFAVVMNLYS